MAEGVRAHTQTASEAIRVLREIIGNQPLARRNALDAGWKAEDDAAKALNVLDALAVRLTEAETALARALWQIDDPDADVTEWDDDGLLAETYDEYLARARAVLSGDAADNPAAGGPTTEEDE